MFSRPWRLRRHLTQAYLRPDDPQTIRALEEACRRQAAALPAGSGDATIEEALTFLVWANLRQQSLPAAASWLDELDTLNPSLPTIRSPRWQLMGQLLEMGDVAGYSVQARAFLSHPLIDYEKNSGAILDAIKTVYERVSSQECATVIEAANPALLRNEAVKASLDLSRCPRVFTTLEEGRSWADKIQPDVFTFSHWMRSDALLVRARAAELGADWQSMYLHSVAAFVEKPDHPPARYWMVRTKLYAADADPTAGLNLDTTLDSDEWRRLLRLTQLYRQPTFENAAEFVPLLADSENPLDPSEKNLTITLLKKALTIRPNWDSEKAAQCALLCDKIEQTAGRQPWTQLNIAIQEIRWDGKYAAATARLEDADVIKEQGALTLARIARVFSGAPSLGSQPEGPPCLSLLEKAMETLLSISSGELQPHDTELLEQLDQAHEDSLFEEFPALSAVADGLRFAGGVLLRGNHPSTSIPVSGFLPSTPRWVVWLNARAAIVQAMSAGSASLPDGLEGVHEVVDAEVKKWAAVYKNQLSEVSDVSLTSPGAVQLGEMCDLLCELERSFETAYVELRRQLHRAGEGKGRIDEVLASAEKLGHALDQLPVASRAWWLPEIVYWTGALQARFDMQRAEELLKSLLSGPKSLAARAQLALLAIKQRDLESAERWIDPEALEHPAMMYAHSLLLVRSDRADEAISILQRAAITFGSSSSPYVLASRRLLAALAERSGNLALAETHYRATLSDFPSDPLTSARLGRLLFHKAYQDAATHSVAGNDELGRLLEDACDERFGPIAWCRELLALQRLLVAEAAELDGSISERKDWPESSALSQVVINKLVQSGHTAVAREILAKSNGVANSRNAQRTRLILRAWDHLSSVWQTSRVPELKEIEAEVAHIRAERGLELDGDAIWQAAAERLQQQAREASISHDALQSIATCLEEFEAFGIEDCDDVLCRWHFLLTRALELHQRKDLALNLEAWEQVAPWVIGLLPGLLTEDESERSRHAQSLAETLARTANLNDDQRRLLEAVSAYETGRDDLFLNAFGELELVLDLLPVDAASMWLAATHIRFNRKMWTLIIENPLPDSIADLSNPQVRLLIALAHVRSAVEDIAKDGVYEAQRKVRQAKTLMAPLLVGEKDAA